jgi:hypothetical protein
MYVAKKSGRNRAVFDSGEDAEPPQRAPPGEFESDSA